MNTVNHMRLEFDARPENESFARIVTAAFAVPMNPTMDVLSDVRTAVSEAVTNAIVHAYREQGGIITLDAALREDGSSRSSTRAAALPTWKRPCSPSLPPSPKRSAAAWAFP